MTSHLDEGTIHELIDGEIGSVELPPIQAHLAQCAECRARLQLAQATAAEADTLIEALDDGVPVSAAPAPHPARTYRSRGAMSVAWAASLALAAGLGYFARPAAAPDAAISTTRSDEPTATATIGAGPPLPAAPPTVTGNAPRVAEASPERVTQRRRDAANEPMPGSAQAIGESKSLADAAADTTRAVRKEGVDNTAGAAALALQPGVMASPGSRTTISALSAETSRQVLAPAPTADAAFRSAVGRRHATTFDAAVKMMGGRLRLIDGLIPVRFEIVGSELYVFYVVGSDEVALAQSLVDGVPVVRLVAPSDFPGDSLASLRRRVRE